MTLQIQDTFATGGRGSPNAWSPISTQPQSGGPFTWAQTAGSATLGYSGGSNTGTLTGNTSTNILSCGPKLYYYSNVLCQCIKASSVASRTGCVARVVSGNTYYAAYFASGTLTLVAVVSGTSTTLGTYTFSETLGTTYSVRLQVTGQTSNTVSAKVWSGGTEPASWQISVSADTHIVAPGLPGVYGQGNSAGETLSYTGFSSAWPSSGIVSQTGANPYGLVITNNPATDPTGIEMAYNTANAGYGWIRWQQSWKGIENSQTPPYYNWTALDSIVQAVNALGLNLLLMIHDPPPWHMISPCGPGYQFMDPTAAGKFAQVLVNHYNLGSAGHFEAIEWGNEDYSKGYGKCPKGIYAAQLMAQVYPAIKALSPSIAVGPPATYMSNKGTPWWYGDPQVGFFPNGGGANIDFLNIHDYPCPLGPLDPDNSGMRMVDYLTLVNTVATQQGYPNMPIRITENAWSWYNNAKCQVQDGAHQSSDYQAILEWCRQNTPVVTHHFWYNMGDLARYNGAGQVFNPAYTMMQNEQQTYPQWVGNTSNYKASVLQDTPYAYYRVDESSGPNASDSSGANRTATYAASGVTYGVAGLLTGDSDTAVSFDGVHGNILCPTSINMTGWTKLSLECWVKPTNFTNTVSLFSNDTPSATNRGMQFNIPSGGTKLNFAIGLGTSFVSFQPSVTLSAGTAYYLAATWDGATMTVYVNGASIGTQACSGAIASPSAQVGIGYNPKSSGNYLIGTMDEPAIYNGVLSAARVSAHYAAGGGGATAPVLSVTPSALTPQTPGVTHNGSTYSAVVSLSESSASVGNAHWSTSSSLGGVTFTPASGTLSPGQAVNVTISTIPASTGTFTFSGSEGEVPVVVPWTVSGPSGPGGFGVYANCSGTASFDHLRVTQYPDPGISLAPVLPRAGQSVVTWDANLPTNTGLAVAISYDGVNWLDVSDNLGGSLPNLTSQNPPVFDVFASNSRASYLQTQDSSGSPASWTWDTANSRLVSSGGSLAALLNTTLSGSEWAITFDLDEADVAGVVWNWVDTGDYYALSVTDGSATHGTASQVKLIKVSSDTPTTLASASISFVRGTIHRFQVSMLAGVMTVLMDNSSVLTATDTTPLGVGQAGCYTTGGSGALARWYSLWLCPQGQNVSGTPAGDTVTGQFVYSQWSLSTTDPTVGPQVTDDVISVRSPTIETGTLVSQLHSANQPFAEYVSSEIQNLVSQNGDWWAKIDQNKVMNFRSPNAVPAPIVLSSVGGPAFSNVKVKTKQQAKVTLGGDTYRNQQTVLPVEGTITPDPYIFISDGNATSWTVGYPIVSTPSITVNGQAQTVGQTGIDTGKTFYWQPGNNSVSLAQGLSAFPYGYVIAIAITGSYQTIAQVSDAAGIAARAAIETGTSGIVEQVYQIPNQSGSNVLLPYTQGVNMAQGFLSRFEHETTDLLCDTLMAGLAPGQTVAVFLPEHGLWNKQLVIFKVQVQLLQTPGSPVYVYSIEASDGANIGPWAAALSRKR